MKKQKREIQKKDSIYSLAQVKETQLLDDDRLDKLTEIKEDLVDGFRNLEWGRPKYLMEVSVLKDMKFPLPDSKYWQCILERDTQFRNLLFSALDFKEKQGEVMEKDAMIKELMKEEYTETTQAKIVQFEAQRDRASLQARFTKKDAEERCREIFAWTDLIRELEPNLKYSKNSPEEHMPESYLIRFAHQKRILDQIGTQDMNGAMNLIGLGETAARYWREKQKEEKK